VKLVRPASVADAVAALEEPGSIAYAGGIEVLLALRSGALDGKTLVDTKRIAGATGVSGSAAEVRVGPATRHHDIAADPLVRRHLPVLAAACGRLGTVRVRMQGTLGGNLAYGLLHTDPGTAAVLYGGTITLTGPAGQRSVDVDRFWLGRGRVDRLPEEVIVDIRLRPLGPGWVSAHERIAVLHRPPTVIVSLAARVEHGRIREFRIAVGGVGDGPQRLAAVEAALADCDGIDIGVAARDGTADLRPASDLLGSADYKRRAVAALVKRAAERIWSAAGKEAA
jgi:aerobic carbon-monoxide dehydrogenase medium subunit